MGKFKDLTGKTFGRLHVIERDIEYEKEYLKTHNDIAVTIERTIREKLSI